MPTAPKPACQPQRSAMKPPSTTPSTDPIMPAARKAPSTVLRIRAGNRLASRAAPTVPYAASPTPTRARAPIRLPVAGGERARDRRETPDQRHQEDALDAAPPVGEQRQRNRAQRDGDRDDRDERAQLAVRKVPLRLEVREHRHHDLAVDVVDDHQREQDREHRPRVTTRCRTVVRRVEGNVSRREGHASRSPGAEPALGPRNSSRSDAALDGVNSARTRLFRLNLG